MSDRNTAAGNRFNQIIFLGSDGFPTGKTTSRPAAGTSTNGGMLRLYGAKQATPTVPTPSPVVVTAEDGYTRHEYNFPSDQSRGFEIQLAEEDLRTAMRVQNMPLTEYAGGQVGYVDIQDVQLPSVATILQSWAIDSETGVKKWSGLYIPSGQLAYLGRDSFNERTGALFRYFLTPQPSAYDMIGATIIDSDGTAKNSAYLPFRGFDYPVTMHAYSGNASATAFVTDYQPVNVASSKAATERSNQAIASVQTTAPLGITFSAAPISGGRGVMFFQFRS
jgi:hypothetical protein